jgi:hypothetical protein
MNGCSCSDSSESYAASSPLPAGPPAAGAAPLAGTAGTGAAGPAAAAGAPPWPRVACKKTAMCCQLQLQAALYCCCAYAATASHVPDRARTCHNRRPRTSNRSNRAVTCSSLVMAALRSACSTKSTPLSVQATLPSRPSSDYAFPLLTIMFVFPCCSLYRNRIVLTAINKMQSNRLAYSCPDDAHFNKGQNGSSDDRSSSKRRRQSYVAAGRAQVSCNCSLHQTREAELHGIPAAMALRTTKCMIL